MVGEVKGPIREAAADLLHSYNVLTKLPSKYPIYACRLVLLLAFCCTLLTAKVLRINDCSLPMRKLDTCITHSKTLGTVPEKGVENVRAGRGAERHRILVLH